MKKLIAALFLIAMVVMSSGCTSAQKKSTTYGVIGGVLGTGIGILVDEPLAGGVTGTVIGGSYGYYKGSKEDKEESPSSNNKPQESKKKESGKQEEPQL